MNHSEKTRQMLLAHCKKYPLLQLGDLFKFIHQSAFGCEHLVQDIETATARIRTEAAGCKTHDGDIIEPLNGDCCRVHLDILKDGLSVETLGKLFVLSAEPNENGLTDAQEQLKILQTLAAEGSLPFTADEVENAIHQWLQNGFCACRHTDAFRSAYAPAYRVIKKEYAPFLPLLTQLDRRLQNGTVRLAIEGGSASGKTTLSKLLQQLYGCTVFHMDDFFLRPEQRTAERFAEPGGNVDRERFLSEVLIPMSENKPVLYRRFDCSTFTLQEPVEMHPTPLTVIEGAYSCHPDLSGFYDLTVFLDITPERQKQRILKRNGETFAQRFFNEWIPMEHLYFDKMDIKNRCDLHIRTE